MLPLEKLIGPQLAKNFFVSLEPEFHFISLRRGRHPFLPWTRSFQYMFPFYFLNIHFNIILPSNRRSSKWFPSFGFSHQNPTCTSHVPHTCHLPSFFHILWFDSPDNIWWGILIMKLPIMKSKEGKNSSLFTPYYMCVSKINDLHCTIVQRLSGFNVCLNNSHFNFWKN